MSCYGTKAGFINVSSGLQRLPSAAKAHQRKGARQTRREKGYISKRSSDQTDERAVVVLAEAWKQVGVGTQVLKYPLRL